MRLFGGLPTRVVVGLSGSHLHSRVEVDLPRGPGWHHASLAWAWKTDPVGPHSAEMELNCHLDASEGCVDGLAGSHASWQIWD
jgi:hypothetical protein